MKNTPEIIWDFLYSKLCNPYGVAALMGNLEAESSLNPFNATGTKLSNADYTLSADIGAIDFVHDSVAYGLAQWCYYSRKQGLLDKALSQQKSVGDINVQLEYLWEELQKYKTVLTTLKEAKDVRTASDIVMLKYEKPANTSEAMKQKRAARGQKYLEKYSDTCTYVTIEMSKKDAKELKEIFELKLNKLL